MRQAGGGMEGESAMQNGSITTTRTKKKNHRVKRCFPWLSRGKSENDRPEQSLKGRGARDDVSNNEENASASITKAVVVLRTTVLVLLICTATILSVGVFFYTKNNEERQFETHYEMDALRVLDSVQHAVEYQLGAIGTFANSITSHALATNQTFPMVTIPHFALRGADVRVQAAASVIHWLPLVTDDKRDEWEKYAFENRFQIDKAFEQDQQLRQQQDIALGLEHEHEHEHGIILNDAEATADMRNDSGSDRLLQKTPQDNYTLNDGTGYHPRIHSVGSVTEEGDDPDGSGPFLPQWQRR